MFGIERMIRQRAALSEGYLRERLAILLVVAVMTVAAFAQNGADLESAAVLRVAREAEMLLRMQPEHGLPDAAAAARSAKRIGPRFTRCSGWA